MVGHLYSDTSTAYPCVQLPQPYNAFMKHQVIVCHWPVPTGLLTQTCVTVFRRLQHIESSWKYRCLTVILGRCRANIICRQALEWFSKDGMEGDLRPVGQACTEARGSSQGSYLVTRLLSSSSPDSLGCCLTADPAGTRCINLALLTL